MGLIEQAPSGGGVRFTLPCRVSICVAGARREKSRDPNRARGHFASEIEGGHLDPSRRDGGLFVTARRFRAPRTFLAPPTVFPTRRTERIPGRFIARVRWKSYLETSFPPDPRPHTSRWERRLFLLSLGVIPSGTSSPEELVAPLRSSERSSAKADGIFQRNRRPIRAPSRALFLPNCHDVTDTRTNPRGNRRNTLCEHFFVRPCVLHRSRERSYRRTDANTVVNAVLHRRKLRVH